jgi:TolA-binding protein
VSYPDPAVTAELRAHFICARIDITQARAAAREARILWTPTITFWSRHRVLLRESVGFLPPALLLQQLRFVRGLDALRSAQFEPAAELFRQISDAPDAGDLAPEAFYWIGIAGYIRDRDHTALHRAWRPLRERWPHSSWAARTVYGDELP